MNNPAARRLALSILCGTLAAGVLSATTFVPISDSELSARADVIVHGIVVSSRVGEDPLGRLETVTVVEPLELLKGRLAGFLVLHQLGGQLPDGRFAKIWGTPQYAAGHEVVVFAVARPEGDYQTAELFLGKFEIQADERGVEFAVPELAIQHKAGAEVGGSLAAMGTGQSDDPATISKSFPPRELGAFLQFLRTDAWPPEAPGSPVGPLQPVLHPELVTRVATPQWANSASGLWRWNNGAGAVWTLDGLANITGGGTVEASNATVTWNNEPNSTIAYSVGSGTTNSITNRIHLNALSSPCGWSACVTSAGGIIGCGQATGTGSHIWAGETYTTITGGEVWLRSYCNTNLYGSALTQSVLTHELGHTLGLGHSDQGASPHDVCRGDENLAQMRSTPQDFATLGTDDSDAVRWLYGDGGNSCTASQILTVTKAGSGSGTVTSGPAWISCGLACSAAFSPATAVTLSVVPDSNSVFAGWSGDSDCSDGSVSMTAAKTCTANFFLLPDLTISSLIVSTPALPGSQVSVSETTANLGGPTATGSTTRYYLSTKTTYDATAALLGSRAIPALSAGGSSSATLSLTIPSGTVNGAYYILARADADGQISESNESNNVRATAIQIGYADLIVYALTVPATGGAGLTITVTDTTMNQKGTQPATASVTRFYLSSDSTLDASDVALGYRNVPALAAGASSSGSTVLMIPSGTPVGSYYVIARADADNTVPETNQTNNNKYALIKLSPDLIISSLTVPLKAARGATISVSDTTKNQGTGSAIATTTSFYLSANTTFDASDVLLGSRSVPMLLYGGTSSATSSLTIPSGTPAGTYYILARADAGNAVAEASKTNNVLYKAISITP